MLYQTKRLLVEAQELANELADEEDGELIGMPGDWIVRKLGGQEWYLVPAQEFAEHYEPATVEDDVKALEDLVNGRPEGEA